MQFINDIFIFSLYRNKLVLNDQNLKKKNNKSKLKRIVWKKLQIQ